MTQRRYYQGDPAEQPENCGRKHPQPLCMCVFCEIAARFENITAMQKQRSLLRAIREIDVPTAQMKIIKAWRTWQGRPFPVHQLDVEHACGLDSGRRVGGYARIDDRRSVNPPGDQRFELTIVSTRDGHASGAMRPGSFFGDLEVAKREALRRLTRQGKTYVVKYGAAS